MSSLRPSLASPRSKMRRRARLERATQSGAQFRKPVPPQMDRGVGRSINPSRRSKKRLLKVGTELQPAQPSQNAFEVNEEEIVQLRPAPVNIEEVLSNAKSSSYTRPAIPASKFAWNMTSPVSNQRKTIRDQEIEDERFDARPQNPLESPRRPRIPVPVETSPLETAVDQLFNCSPMPSPQNSPRQRTLIASPVKTVGKSSINLDIKTDAAFASPVSPKSPTPTNSLLQRQDQPHGKDPMLEPVVMVSYQAIPGSPPRRVVVERKRVAYAECNLTDMITQAGVDLDEVLYDIVKANHSKHLSTTSGSTESNTKLPLKIFDNTDFEMYSGEEWIRRGTNDETGKVSIPARSMLPSSGSTIWHPCRVIAYDSSTDMYSVQWQDEDDASDSLVELRSRLQICFDAEDPSRFVNRLVFAHSARSMAEGLIRYNLYIDCMYKELTRAGQLSTTGHSTNFVMWLELPSGTESIYRKSLVSETNMQVSFADSDKWVRAGVAAFCALKY